MKDLVHLKYSFGCNNLCNKQSILWHTIDTYIHDPTWNYISGYAWCPDCLKHPDLVMAALNKTNV